MVYFTMMNELYHQPMIPEGSEEGILKGLYRLSGPLDENAEPRVHLFGSGAIINESIKAQSILAEQFGIESDVWSATSYKELYRDALATERRNRLHPEKDPEIPYINQALGKSSGGVYVAATDYMKMLPESIANWIPGRLISLGTDGFGRSDGRDHLRKFFEVNADHITLAALQGLSMEGEIEKEKVRKAVQELDIDPDKPDPMTA
jgi:pyruvate dehydrogenase E1 component